MISCAVSLCSIETYVFLLRLGSFRSFWVSTDRLRVKLGSFRSFWVSTDRLRVKLGSFRKNSFWLLAFGRAGIGFVSMKQGVAGHLVRGNWVRFAEMGTGRPARRQRYVGIGFVSHIWRESRIQNAEFSRGMRILRFLACNVMRRLCGHVLLLPLFLVLLCP
jgi:hypothetical protein